MSVSAERTPAADCCGATLIHSFYGSGEAGFGLRSFRSGHLYFAILTKTQSDKYSKTLTDAGFRAVSKTIQNSNTGSLLYMWVRDREKVKKKLKTLKQGMFK